LFKRVLVVFSYVNTAKDGERAKPIRHDAQRLTQAPFEGDPTYRSNSIIFFYEKTTTTFSSS